jgi:hypothetical protein
MQTHIHFYRFLGLRCQIPLFPACRYHRGLTAFALRKPFAPEMTAESSKAVFQAVKHTLNLKAAAIKVYDLFRWQTSDKPVSDGIWIKHLPFISASMNLAVLFTNFHTKSRQRNLACFLLYSFIAVSAKSFLRVRKQAAGDTLFPYIFGLPRRRETPLCDGGIKPAAFFFARVIIRGVRFPFLSTNNTAVSGMVLLKKQVPHTPTAPFPAVLP